VIQLDLRYQQSGRLRASVWTFRTSSALGGSFEGVAAGAGGAGVGALGVGAGGIGAGAAGAGGIGAGGVGADDAMGAGAFADGGTGVGLGATTSDFGIGARSLRPKNSIARSIVKTRKSRASVLYGCAAQAAATFLPRTVTILK